MLPNIASWRLHPCIPHWVTLAREDEMRVHDAVLSCTGFVGYRTERGFIADGTGFFVHAHWEDYDFCYFVTAKHLVWPDFLARGAKAPQEGEVWIRINKLRPDQHPGSPEPIKTEKREWLFHPDPHVDLCVYPFDLERYSPDYFEINPMNLAGRSLPKKTVRQHMVPDFHLPRGLALGEEVFIVGAFVGRIGERRNIPIIRVATVAAQPIEPVTRGSPRHPAYLIETKSLGGTSGAPVFTHPDNEPFHNRPKNPNEPYRFVGMVLGAHSNAYLSDFVSEADADEAPPALKDVDFNAGISVVLPADPIKEFLESAEMKAAREATVKARQSESGYFPTSASGRRKDQSAAKSAPPAKAIEGDDQHQERFTSLLDAALGKPKQGG